MKRDLQRASPLGVPMVSSSAFITSIDGERLPYNVSSLDKTIRFGSLFITNRFDGMSFSDGSGTIIMGPTHGEPPLPSQATTGGPIKGLPTTPNREGRTDLPFLGRHGVVAPPTPTMTTSWSESSPTDQATMTIPPR
jgi:hypothetical protein